MRKKLEMTMKRNILTLILAGFAALGWLTVLYQNELREASEKRIEQSVIDQLYYRMQVEDSIKSEMDARRKTRAYVVQLEHERQIAESLDQRVTGVEQRQSDYEQQVRASLGQQLGDFGQKQAFYEQQLAGYKDQVASLNRQRESDARQMAEHAGRLSAQDKLIAEQGSELAGEGVRIEQLKNELSSVRTQLQEYVRLANEYRDRQAVLEEQLSELKKQPQAAVPAGTSAIGGE
ncbi:MAG: hypothetical protein PHJ00_02270 [Candidatus Omnitrophica bacterium]|nr:hypothetical protein [Candidatus Omnitrophota bacterium]MDD5654968.1 hypothetical protein [Candidatus Omnitrophota bacterium]